ncbi:MAG TPA: radical SAM protein [Bacteroidales bacterium]|nr:radical SAM protein [Bacteroidales bacterium]
MIRNKSKISASLPDEVLSEYYAIISDKLLCRAPYTSLYFHPDGEVGACCLNKNSFFYGKYPRNNIEEILNSNRRKLHQGYVKSNNLILGCNVCQENLLAGNYSGVMSLGYKNQNLKNHITRIDFELSHQCNLNCIMCERDKGNPVMVYNSNFIEEIQPLLKNIEYANFIGGEPFLINIYYDIWNIINKINPKCMINVQTNGSILNERVINLLNNRNFLITISLDSVNKTSFEKIRRNGNFNTVIKNFHIFNQNMNGKLKTMQVSVCPLTVNRYEITEIIDFANTNYCNVFFNYVDNPKHLSLKYLSSEKLNETINNYKKYIKDYKLVTPHAKNNLEAIKGLLELLEKWNKDTVKREHESIEIQRQELVSIFSKIREEQNKEIINELLSILPKNIKLSKQKYKDVKSMNIDEKLNELKKRNLKKKEILIIALSFFEFYQFENDFYE